MIWIPIVIALLALLRCFTLEKRARRLERRIDKLMRWINRWASGSTT